MLLSLLVATQDLTLAAGRPENGAQKSLPGTEHAARPLPCSPPTTKRLHCPEALTLMTAHVWSTQSSGANFHHKQTCVSRPNTKREYGDAGVSMTVLRVSHKKV